MQAATADRSESPRASFVLERLLASLPQDRVSLTEARDSFRESLSGYVQRGAIPPASIPAEVLLSEHFHLDSSSS